MKILITGGNGYISKSIYNSLYKIYNITSITRKDFDLENTEAVNDWFKDKTFDIVIHAAIKGGSRLKIEERSIKNSNLKMFNNLLINKDKFKKLISFGSGAEIYMKDTSYGESKSLINNIIQKEPNFYNIRIFAVFDENELNTRFIKSNLLRYINKQSIVIHANRLIDFFYMKDLQELIFYYISNENLPKEIDCSYKNKKSLLEIANFINTLDEYKVPIIIEKGVLQQDYCGVNNLPIKTIGLEEGIKNTFRKLKQLYP
jgi:dTDP-4-dehydrorhamnose reductase